MKQDKILNKTFEFSDKIGKFVKIILSNTWHFSGTILEVDENTLIILDKHNQRTTLSKKDIMICTEVKNGSQK